MSKFSKNKKRKGPAISTASLPDIVFMLLFFFMVTSVSKEKESTLKVEKPTASAVTKLDKTKTIFNYFIGKPKSTKYGENYRVQLDDALVPNMTAVGTYLKEKKEEYKDVWNSDVYNNFKIDGKAEIRTVKGVQDELREQDALKVIYSVKEGKQ